MAQSPPSSIDVVDIQFKKHDKFTVFNAGDQLRSSLNLLATSSNFGLMFVGNPNEAELKVILIKDIVDGKSTGKGLHARQVQLPNLPNSIATSCDGSMLAVNYTQNGCGFVAIYSVPSFTTANIKSIHNIRLPGDDSIMALQLLWNPVIPGSLAVVMSNGAMGMYEFKNGSYEFHTLDSKEQISCGSWSPKGKQIVLGFPNGKIAQYKPDLKLARTIACPPNIHPGPFKTLSIQWLSTYQFAVVFLQQGEEAMPSLYIVNAPKAGGPTYTTYYDICYSAAGPRTTQVNLTHIQPWNLLLVTSANSVEVGILGTKESTEAPTWVQYTLLDEARIELPLTEEKDETYPIGFALDTSSMHQLTIAEKQMPVMPMIHILSTHGHLISFNFLNLQPNTPDICSPPPPPSDTSGMSQFKPVSEMLGQKKAEITIPAPSMPLGATGPSELSFAPLGSTSTPAPPLEKPKAIFGTIAAQPSGGTSVFGSAGSGFSFGNTSSVAPTSGSTSLFKTTAPVKTVQPSVGFGDMKKQPDQGTTSTNVVNVEKSKPLYTVPPTFTPPSAVVTAPTAQQAGKLSSMNANEVDDIVNEMISMQIMSFDMELKKLGGQSKGLLNNIGSPDEMKGYTKRLNDMQEIVDQANEREFESDLQSLRNLLNESYAMVAECRSKLNMYNNPDIAKLTSASNCNPINRRQLAKLNSYLANNQAQLQIIHNQIDAQWSSFQDIVRRNSRTQMHTPCLEGVYQRMTKLKDMLARERTKLNYIKSKLKEKGLLYNQQQNNTKSEATMESLTDTILSMSLAPTVEESRSKLTKEKLNAIRELLNDRKITIIKPQRPDRVGIKSEVILETKLKSDRKIRDGASTNMVKMEQERIKSEQQRVLTKPTATKALPPNMTTISQPNAPASFGSGGMSPFVKPSPAKSEDHKKDQPGIVKPVASTAAPMFLKATQSPTTATSSAFSGYGTQQNATPAFSGFSIPPTTMPAFSGFGNNTISFGAPKPLMANQQAKDLTSADIGPKEPSGPLNFAPKPMTSEVKPFGTSSFSSPFTAVAPSSKSAEPVDKENKAPENKQFMPVATKPETSAASAVAPPIVFGSSTGASSGFSFGNSNMSAGTPAKSTSATGSSTPFTFSFSSALNSGSDTSTSAASKPAFGGFSKPTPAPIKSEVEGGDREPKSDAVETGSGSGFTFNLQNVEPALNLGTLGLPASPDLSPTPSVSTIDSASQSSVATVNTTSAAPSEPTDSLFGSLNICKPTTAENGAFKSAFGGNNLFGSISSASDTPSEVKSIFGAPTVSKESSGFTGFGNATDSTKSAFENTSLSTSTAAATTPASSISASTTSTAAPSNFGLKTTQSFSFGGVSAATTPGSIATGQVSSSTTAPSVFSTPSAGTSIFASVAAPTATSTAAPPVGGSLFGGTTFGSATSQPTTSSIFGTTVSSAANTTVVSPFAGVTSTAAIPAATPFGAASTASTGIFASAAAATTTPAVPSSSSSIFGGIPKPDQSVFAQSDGSMFGGTSPDNSASGGSLFGGQTSAFGGQSNSNTGGSIFGGASSTSPFSAAATNSGGNIFGNQTPTSAAPNVFGTPAQPAAATGGSIFDQSSATGQSGGSLFGGGGAQTGFASPFGGNTSAGGSIFGGSATSTPPKPSSFGTPTPAPSAFGSGSGGFGLFSQNTAFGSPTQAGPNAGSGSFAQGGSSITQTGFGSPPSNTGFAKPGAFGAAPAFGAPPAFGSPPSFGAASTFGSPKGFGSFAAPAAPTGGSFTSPTFEALGSSDQGLSFGNLAQTANANQQKPAFGGSSFMSYRS